MAFRIERTDQPDNYVDFEIVTNDGNTHNVRILKNDCLPPETVAKLREMLASIEEEDFVDDVTRAEFKILAPGHDDMFDQLTTRQIVQIRDHYRAESEGDQGGDQGE